MATKKKTKKKRARPNRTAGKKLKATESKKLAKKKMASKKAAQQRAVKTKASGKRTIGGERMAAPKKPHRRKSQSVDTVALSVEETVSHPSGQAGDLQGLSNLERASSESVDELLEEGNAFEADVIMGVEAAEAGEGREVHTHEVPEDDVPGEYLDKD